MTDVQKLPEVTKIPEVKKPEVKKPEVEKMSIDNDKPEITDLEIYDLEDMDVFTMEELGEKVEEVAKYNLSTIELIRSRLYNEVITGYKYSFDYELECYAEEGEPTWEIDAIPVKKQVSTCVNQWQYLGEPLDVIDNVFNDDIDYTMNKLEDVERLTKQFHGIGMKYSLLIYRPRLHETLMMIVTNMKKLQAAADDLHVLSVDFEESISNGSKATKGMGEILSAYRNITEKFPSMTLKLHSKEYIGYEAIPETLGTDPDYEQYGSGSTPLNIESSKDIVTFTSVDRLSKKKNITAHSSCIRDILLYDSGNKSHLATCGDDGTIKLWNFDAGDVIEKFSEHESHVNALAKYTINGKPFRASASNDNTIKIWDLTEKVLHATLSGHEKYVRALTTFEKDGKVFLASGSADQMIKIWDLEENSEVMTLNDGRYVYCLTAFVDPRNKKPFLASGGHGSMINVWDLTAYKVVTTFEGHKQYIWDIVPYTKGGAVCLASASADGTVKLWNVSDDVLIKTLTGHSGIVNKLDLFVTERSFCLASGDSKGVVKLWNLTDKKCMKSLKTSSGAGITSLATFNYDGAPILAAGTFKDIEIWSE